MSPSDLDQMSKTLAAVRQHVVLGQRRQALLAIDLLSDLIALHQDHAEAKAKAEAVENFK